MMKRLITLCLACLAISMAHAQEEVLQTARKANDYFMTKYSDPTLPTNVKKIRPAVCGHALSTTKV